MIARIYLICLIITMGFGAEITLYSCKAVEVTLPERLLDWMEYYLTNDEYRDYNQDGIVNLEDYAILLKGYE